jgi:hypothetical protein
VSYAKGDGTAIASELGLKQKTWMASNFRVQLGNLPCQRISKIDAFTIKLGVTEQEAVGMSRIPQMGVPRVEFPNLIVTFGAADAPDWEKWFQDFVVKGNNGQDKELTGIIEFLDPTLTTVVGSIALKQVGIFALREETTESGSDKIARYVAELYVEAMTLEIKA